MRHVIKLKPGDPDFYLFENFPEKIYPADSTRFKLPDQLNTDLLASCYVLMDDGEVKSRAALYNNPYLSYNDKKTFCVGNYESVDDLNASFELLQHISLEAKNAGGEFLIGPMNGSTWDSYRFSTHHEHPNFFLEPYHHLYYNHHFLNAGFHVIGKYFSNKGNIIHNQPELIERENELKNAGVNFRNIDLADFENDLEKLYELSSIAFKKNFLYTPISKAAFLKKYNETRKVVNPEFVVFAEDKNKQLIGFLFCVNDFFNTREKSLIIKTAARHPDNKWRGLAHVLFNIVCVRALEQNYTSLIHAFMYDGGTSVGITKDFSGNEYKNYALYGKPL